MHSWLLDSDTHAKLQLKSFCAQFEYNAPPNLDSCFYKKIFF